MADQRGPNDASKKSQAEGERWQSEPDAVERYAEDAGSQDAGHAGGITNRPLDEEVGSQEAVPRRGASRDGAHAGHGDDNRRQEESER
jgi:hypothetical protein